MCMMCRHTCTCMCMYNVYTINVYICALCACVYTMKGRYYSCVTVHFPIHTCTCTLGDCLTARP